MPDLATRVAAAWRDDPTGASAADLLAHALPSPDKARWYHALRRADNFAVGWLKRLEAVDLEHARRHDRQEAQA